LRRACRQTRIHQPAASGGAKRDDFQYNTSIMKYRILGKTEMKISVIGIGTWQFGGEWGKMFTQEEVTRMLSRGLEQGINFIDTAECYGDHLSEQLIGAAVERRRGKWFLATKIGHVYHSHLTRSDKRSGEDAIAQCEASLKALRTNYVDLLQYHSIRNEEFDADDLQAAMLKLKQQGKVRHIGSSISPADNAHQVINSRKGHVEAIQVVYNRLERKAEKEVIPECAKQNLGILARVPLASGYLSGKYKPGVKFPENDVRSTWKPEDLDERLKEVERIAKEEVPEGVSMAQWALAWCLKNHAVTCVIPGARTVEQIEDNIKAVELVERI
jgi:aryl-alcohol dehydrogenase-like predicted oxidoreductase